MMKKIEVFDRYYKDYEEWFIKNRNIFLSELKVIKSFVDDNLKGIEIGVGSGIFAEPLGIKYGIEPSEKMGEIAKKRGINVIRAFAEEIPFDDESFDFALMVTTICFVDDPIKSLKEAYRIIKKDGFILVGFVPLDSHLGSLYNSKKEGSKFYKDANFYKTSEVRNFLEIAGFKNIIERETLFENTNDYVQDYGEGSGKGSFVVMKGEKE
ncbi:MAG: class I SAM-dependent methyltransferase [Brevinematia bacterium]